MSQCLEMYTQFKTISTMIERETIIIRVGVRVVPVILACICIVTDLVSQRIPLLRTLLFVSGCSCVSMATVTCVTLHRLSESIKWTLVLKWHVAYCNYGCIVLDVCLYGVATQPRH